MTKIEADLVCATVNNLDLEVDDDGGDGCQRLRERRLS